MSTGGIVTLAVQGVVFLAWGATMFVTLFQLRAATARRYGGGLMNIGNTFRGFGDFLTGAEWRARRRLLLALTLALFATIALRAALLFQ